MRFVEVFAGGGGVACAAALLGLHAESHVERDPEACATLRAAGFSGVLEVDATTYELPVGLDLVWFSPPCQPWSRAGKRKGAADSRDLVGWTLDSVDRARPTWAIIENVPGAPVEDMVTRLQGMGYETAAWLLDAADYGRVWPCALHRTLLTTPALSAASDSQAATEPDYAVLPAMTAFDIEAVTHARSVVAALAPLMCAVFAENATCEQRADSLLRLARLDPRTRLGVADATWTRVGMSVFSSVPASTVESIALWLSACWDDPFLPGRSSIMSTAIPVTTIQRIWRCIAAMDTTLHHTGTGDRTGECGLCFDWATPQHRRRWFVVAGPRLLPIPRPTHAEVPGPLTKPWRSMGEALPALVLPSVGVQGDTAVWVRDPVCGEVVYFQHEASRAGTEQWRLLKPSPTVTVQEVKGTRASASSGWTFNGGPDRASDSAFLAVGRRRLTVQEVATLQGFPKDWPWRGTKTGQYRQVGNAVAVELAHVVLRAVLQGGWPE